MEDFLTKLGIEENNLVIYVGSDNGGTSGIPIFNAGMRGGKGSPYQGGTRVPCFIRWPAGGIPAGSESAALSAHIDIFPTLAEITGAKLSQETQEQVEGLSLLPLLRGGSIEERPLYWHYPHYGNQGGDPSSILREGEWKLIHYWEDGSAELYNLKSDPDEHEDVSGEHPERVQAMSDKLDSWLKEVGARYPEPDPEYSAALYRQWEERIQDQLWPKLEKDRMDYLSPGWKPNADWWGSKLTED